MTIILFRGQPNALPNVQEKGQFCLRYIHGTDMVHADQGV